MARAVAEPLRALTEAERQELTRVTRAPSEAHRHNQRATALLSTVRKRLTERLEHQVG